MVEPIRPEQVAGLKRQIFPDAVVESFNELIARNDDGGTIRITISEARSMMVSKGIDEDEIVDKGYFNVEEIYREAGWKVELNCPECNETYEQNFTFSRP